MTRGLVSATYARVFRDSPEDLAGAVEGAVEWVVEADTSETIVRHSNGRIFGDPVNACRPVTATRIDILAVLLDAVSDTVLWGSP